MSERDYLSAQKLWVSTPEDRRKVRSRPALLERRASNSYQSNQQVIIEFCQKSDHAARVGQWAESDEFEVDGRGDKAHRTTGTTAPASEQASAC